MFWEIGKHQIIGMTDLSEKKKEWDAYVEKESAPTNQEIPSYAHAVGAVYRKADKSDIVVTAAGGLVGEVVQIWKPKQKNTFDNWRRHCRI